MRNVSIRIPDEPLEWIDEQIKKRGRFGSRADVIRAALIDFMNPALSLEFRKVVDVREQGDVLIETAEHHAPFLLEAKDNLSIDVGPKGTQLVVIDLIEPRKLLVKVYSNKARVMFLRHEKIKRKAQEIFSPERLSKLPPDLRRKISKILDEYLGLEGEELDGPEEGFEEHCHCNRGLRQTPNEKKYCPAHGYDYQSLP